jgi:hypothetical protein
VQENITTNQQHAPNRRKLQSCKVHVRSRLQTCMAGLHTKKKKYILFACVHHKSWHRLTHAQMLLPRLCVLNQPATCPWPAT